MGAEVRFSRSVCESAKWECIIYENQVSVNVIFLHLYNKTSEFEFGRQLPAVKVVIAVCLSPGSDLLLVSSS